MSIAFSSDRTGFPLVHLTELGFDVHLLPITKTQFEPFALTDQTFRVIYERASALNPAGVQQTVANQKSTAEPKSSIEPTLMTGVQPDLR